MSLVAERKTSLLMMFQDLSAALNLLCASCTLALAPPVAVALCRCIESVLVKDKPLCPLCRHELDATDLIDPPPPGSAAAAAAASSQVGLVACVRNVRCSGWHVGSRTCVACATCVHASVLTMRAVTHTSVTAAWQQPCSPDRVRPLCTAFCSAFLSFTCFLCTINPTGCRWLLPGHWWWWWRQ